MWAAVDSGRTSFSPNDAGEINFLEVITNTTHFDRVDADYLGNVSVRHAHLSRSYGRVVTGFASQHTGDS